MINLESQESSFSKAYMVCRMSYPGSKFITHYISVNTSVKYLAKHKILCIKILAVVGIILWMFRL